MDEMKDLGKYEPGAIEEKWYNFWEEHGVFHDEPEEGERAVQHCAAASQCNGAASYGACAGQYIAGYPDPL